MKLPEIKIEIRGIEYDNSFADDVQIDRTNLDEEFATQAEKYAYYAFLAEEAKAVHERSKFELEQAYAVIDHEKRMCAAATKAANPKFKMTEKMVENEVLTDRRYGEKKEAVLKAKLLAGQLQQAAIAIAQRRDMLQQLGASARIGQLPTRALEPKQTHARDIVAANQEPADEPAPGLPPDPPASEPERKSRRKPKA